LPAWQISADGVHYKQKGEGKMATVAFILFCIGLCGLFLAIISDLIDNSRPIRYDWLSMVALLFISSALAKFLSM
jgi:hypothetical protein